MGGRFSKSEVSSMSVDCIVSVLSEIDTILHDKYSQIVKNNNLNGTTLLTPLDEREIELFLLDIGVSDYKDRSKLIDILCHYDQAGSLATLDSEALSHLPTTQELRKKGKQAYELKQMGYSALELVEGGYSLSDIVSCSFSDQELKEANYAFDKKITSCTGICGTYSGFVCKDGMAQGEGKCKYSNGDVYEGQWKNNQRCGRGREVKSNGDIYDGSWIQDMKFGHGIETTYHDGKALHDKAGTYIGDFKYNERNGIGTFSSLSGYPMYLHHVK